MPAETYLLGLDQGTTSTRAIVFDTASNIIAVAQEPFAQHYPDNGWVEHDPEDLWRTSLKVVQQAIAEAEAKGTGKVAAIGITNQRETTVLWDKSSGKPVHNAIVWQDRRTAPLCRQLVAQGAEQQVQEKTGLIIDAYFSASKIAWLLDNVNGLRTRAEAGEIAFGTVDSWLVHRFTGGARHVTDATNACRTALFNIHTQQWDKDLLQLWNVPESILPEVLDNAAEFGTTRKALLGREIPILGMAGDQHAAMIGQCCFREGEIKSTYGTGCFALINTGARAHHSDNRLLTTVAYRLNGEVSYALEGSIFAAGTTMQWLRDGLKLFDDVTLTAEMAAGLNSNEGVYLVPAFTGLGAPYWDADARAAISGLTRASSPAHFARAGLEAVAYQTYDLIHAMQADGCTPTNLRIDGGMVANDWMNQFIADITNLTIDKPSVLETTALGAAYLAGLQLGVYENTEAVRKNWQLDQSFAPQMEGAQRQKNLDGWREAVRKVVK